MRPALLTCVFLLLVPGTVAGLIPWWITGWSRQGYPAGWLLIIPGAAILLDSFARFAFEGRGTPAPILPTQQLVVTGLFRYVRNPMYLAVLLVVSGQAILFGSVALAIYAAFLATAFHLFVTTYEEPTLRRQFPGDYDAYSHQVPRWLPRRTPLR
jgi:protein-S-isoprenylcysteine O-methyltransferase Ste14